MSETKYQLALSTLNSLVGIRFAELQAAQQEDSPVAEKVDSLKIKFQECFNRRDQLRSANELELQTVIDDCGPLVRAAVKISSAGTQASA